MKTDQVDSSIQHNSKNATMCNILKNNFTILRYTKLSLFIQIIFKVGPSVTYTLTFQNI